MASPAEYYPKMTFAQRVQMLTHMHFEPGRIATVRVRIAGKLKAPSRKARHEDYKKRLAEFDARLEEITNAWNDAPDLERAAAHAAIDKLDAVGVPLGGV